MKHPKFVLNRIINAFINGYYGRTPHYWERGKYNKAYRVTYKGKISRRVKIKLNGELK